MGNISIVQGLRPDAIMSNSEIEWENDLTVDSGYATTVSGPVKIANVNVNGNLNVITELEVTDTLTVGANGNLNIVG